VVADKQIKMIFCGKYTAAARSTPWPGPKNRTEKWPNSVSNVRYLSQCVNVSSVTDALTFIRLINISIRYQSVLESLKALCPA